MPISAKATLSKLSACLTLLLFSTVAFAQTKGSLTGNVLDSLSKTPVEYATVAIVNAKDTSLISYTLTQKDGLFKLSGIPIGVNTRLIISSMGYGTLRKTLMFKPGEAKNVGPLYLNSKILNEVIVKGERTPIIQRKDTIEFNTEAFKTRPNAVVEDLLKLLPGVQVNIDGSILINGKTVSKLLIDGKRFFGSDPTVGTKNLDADLVDKVQVYDDREEDPDHKLTNLEVNKIINLKMKSKIKKSTIGKVYAGRGTRDRYEAGGIISNFRDTLQISLIGVTNNLTRTGFSNSELSGMGGFNRSGGGVQYDGTFGGNGDGGIEKMWSGGINVNNDYGKKLKTNVMYFYYNYVKDYNKKSLNQQNLDNTLLTTQNTNISQLRQQRHTVSSLIEWNPDTSQRLRFDVRLDVSPTSSDANGFTTTFNTQTPKVSDLLSRSSNNSPANEFSDYLLYYHKLRKPGASITINQDFYFKKSNADDYNFNNLTSYTSAFPSSLLDRYANTKYNYYVAGIAATLNYPFSKKVSNEVYARSRYYSTENSVNTFNKAPSGNYDNFLADQSNDIERPHFIQNLKNTLSYNFNPKLTLKFALDFEVQSFTNNFHDATVPNQTYRYAYLFPSLRLNAEKFSVNYSEGANPPNITQMQPITRQVSPVETASGNPNLTPSRQRSLSYDYYGYNNDKQSYTNMGASVTQISNNIVGVSTKDANGFITSTYANKDAAWEARIGVSKGKQYKKSQNWKLSLNNGFSAYYNQRSFFFNGDGGMQRYYGIDAGQNIGVNYKTIANLSTTYIVTATLTKYKDVNYPSVTDVKHAVTTIASVNWPKHFIFDVQNRFNYYPNQPAGFTKSFNVLNLAETFMFFKQNKGQLKLSVYDLFDQNTTNYRYALNNSITTGENQILKRYFMLTFQYKISTIKK